MGKYITFNVGSLTFLFVPNRTFLGSRTILLSILPVSCWLAILSLPRPKFWMS